MKKTFLSLVAVLSLLTVVSCGPAPHPGKGPAPAPGAPAPGNPAPGAPAPGAPAPGKPVTDGVGQALDYGPAVGRAYNNSRTKIQDINDRHNRELEDALRE